MAKNSEAEDLFAFQCRAYKLDAERQFKMAKPVVAGKRASSWRFDFTFHSAGLIVEIDGGIWMEGGGAH